MVQELAGWEGGDFSAIVLHLLSLGLSPSVLSPCAQDIQY